MKMKLTNEGYVKAEVICPHQGISPATAACQTYPFDGTACAVAQNFREVGMECFEGQVELPTIDIDWRIEGTYDDQELYVTPASNGS